MATTKKSKASAPAKKVVKKAKKISTFVIQLEVELVSDLPVKTLHKTAKWDVLYDGEPTKVVDACVYDQFESGESEE